MDISRQILEDFRKGRLETFYRELYPSLLRYAERTLGAEHAYQAEDCVQEAVYKVYLRRQQFQAADTMKSYLFMSLHNEIVSLFRSADRSATTTPSATTWCCRRRSTASTRPSTACPNACAASST